MKYSKREYCDGLSSCGEMICVKCNEKIKPGEPYSYRELYHYFEFLGSFKHLHRKCSSDDPQWIQQDLTYLEANLKYIQKDIDEKEREVDELKREASVIYKKIEELTK